MNIFFNKTEKQPPPVPTRLVVLTPSVRLLGARRSLLELVENLDRGRWRPTVVCSGRGGLQAALERAGVAHEVIAHRAWRKGRFVASRYVQAWRIAGVAARAGAALIHANEFHALPHALAAARFLAWRTGKRGRFHNPEGGQPGGSAEPGNRAGHRKSSASTGPISPMDRAESAARESRAHPGVLPVTAHVRLGITPRQVRTYHLDRAARVVVVSRAVASLFDAFPSIRRRVRVVYNGVNLERFGPASESERLAARVALGLGAGDFVVGLVGLIGPRKCQHVAVEAVGRLAREWPGLRLALAGEPFGATLPYAETLRETVRREGLGERVLFLGFKEKIREVYGALDLNLLISDEEGFGRTIIEAGAMGVPSVGSRIGGIPELIEEGETGWLIDEGDAGGLGRWLREAREGPERLRRMGEAARRHVVDRFSIQAHVRAMEEVWREAMEKWQGV